MSKTILINLKNIFILEWIKRKTMRFGPKKLNQRSRNQTEPTWYANVISLIEKLCDMHRWFSQQTLRVWGKNEVVQASCLQIKFTWSCSFWKKLISCFQSTICENGGLDFLFFVTGVDWIATKAAFRRNQMRLFNMRKLCALIDKLMVTSPLL